ncbi:MAG TPA: GNAT family protein [Anaerolineae bacterium]|nr:GNAT family protein [Anaerolineae bacterium]HNT05207.1 GNAT family protein [Anaerolineae bacterium]
MNASTTEIQLPGARLTLRDLTRDDLDAMELWPPFSDPLNKLWNIPRSSSLGRDLWFVMHGSDPTRRWYAIERREDRSVIGTLSLREIEAPASARLGIGLGSAYVDQGYGSEALSLFLPYYFRRLGFQRLVLDVAAANQRAVHVYDKLGFRLTGSHYRNVPEETDLSFMQEPAYCHLLPYFRRHFGRTQLLFLDMALERRDWEASHTQPAKRAPATQGARS